MIRAVLFDLGGTLHVCTQTPERKLRFALGVIERLGEYGIPLDISPEELLKQLERNAEIYKHTVEETLREMPPEVAWNDYFLREQNLGREVLSPVAEELSFRYDYDRVCNMRRPDLMPALEKLQKMGLKLGVISNILSKALVPHMMVEYGLDEMMACVLSSAGTGIRKPDPAIFHMAENIMHLPPEEMVYVGDTLSRDVRGVRAAGWRAVIQIESPNAARRDRGLAEAGVSPDFRIKALSEIPEIIIRLNQGG